MRVSKLSNKIKESKFPGDRSIRKSYNGLNSDKKFDILLNEKKYEHLQGLMDEIEEQGQKLAQRLNIEEVIRFKEMVRRFLENIMNEAFQFLKEEFVDHRGRHRLYFRIKKINSELEQLTKDILDRQKDNLQIIKKIYDIKGLLFDLVV